MTQQRARALVALHLLLLLVGTQMPGNWRSNLETAMHAPVGLSSMAHAVLFAGMAGLLAAQPLAWALWRVLTALLCLALVTEGLQFFAIDRHPRWEDVGIDIGGAAAGLLALLLWRWHKNRHP